MKDDDIEEIAREIVANPTWVHETWVKVKLATRLVQLLEERDRLEPSQIPVVSS